MNRKRIIILLALFFSILFSSFYYMLFSVIGTSSSQKTLHMNQVGLYKEEKNLEEAKQKLEEDGFRVYQMKQGDVTALVCGVNEDKKKTEEEQKELADKNYSFIEKSVTVSSDEITDLIKQKKYKEALEKIGNESKTVK
ncbi:SPOR domain-containing protein [Amedibacterium intestinale]|jgi:hypothetical protein|uniref:SPOR domain-containing protein n=1 Tax=Amedibacterium intestinale TaxID=2583452 RepID=UPI000E20C4C8